jgi:hypothetical protein
MTRSQLLIKILTDFLFSFHLLKQVIKQETNHIQKCYPTFKNYSITM